MRIFKTFACEAHELPKLISKYLKLGWELDYVQKLNLKYEVEFSK